MVECDALKEPQSGKADVLLLLTIGLSVVLYLLQSSLNDSSRTLESHSDKALRQICLDLQQSLPPFQTQIRWYIGRYTGIITFLNRKILMWLGKAE